MAINDETIRLILDMGQSGKTADEVRRKLDELGASARKTAESFEVLTGELGTYAVATHQVNDELDEQVRKAFEATQAQKAARAGSSRTSAPRARSTSGRSPPSTAPRSSTSAG